VRHGAAPLAVELAGDGELTLTVSDAGHYPESYPRGLGLQLVERVVDRGLHGSFTLGAGADGTTEARVTFTTEDPCAS
jgi:two-component sensor histidine kinase